MFGGSNKRSFTDGQPVHFSPADNATEVPGYIIGRTLNDSGGSQYAVELIHQHPDGVLVYDYLRGVPESKLKEVLYHPYPTRVRHVTSVRTVMKLPEHAVQAVQAVQPVQVVQAVQPVQVVQAVQGVGKKRVRQEEPEDTDAEENGQGHEGEQESPVLKSAPEPGESQFFDVELSRDPSPLPSQDEGRDLNPLEEATRLYNEVRGQNALAVPAVKIPPCKPGDEPETLRIEDE